MNPVIIPISIILLSSTVFGDYDSYCPTPGVPNYGYIANGRKNNYRVGSEVQYACRYGYKLWGNKRIKCLSKGKVEYWNGPPPECTRDGCGYLKEPRYGYVQHSGTKVGATATYSCRSGYKLEGYPKRRCQYNGYWSGEEAECKPGKLGGCKDLRHPDNGNVKQTGNHVGAKATYSCDYGYELDGPSVRKCLYSGEWSDHEPECMKKAGCEDLPHPDYGKVKQTGNHVGAKATYSCDYGYKLDGPSVRTCLYNGDWSHYEPKCIQSGCEDLPDPDYGKVRQTGNDVGAKATYSCDYGYKLDGPSVRRCLYNGDWSEHEPECLPSRRDCGKLPNPAYGRVYIYGIYAVYKCYSGYKRVGSYYRVCENGYWLGKAPRCVNYYY